MVNEENGPILTPEKRKLLQEEYEGSAQARYDHREGIYQKVKGALSDLQYLFKNQESEELDLKKAFGEGHDHSDNDPIPWERHGNGSGFVANRHEDSEGNPRDSDPKLNPDATHTAELYFKRLEAQNKASPETQEALIDTVAFLCHTAEAGELKISELFEQGIERYYENHPSKESKLTAVNHWDVNNYDQQMQINANRENDATASEDPELIDIPVPYRVYRRFAKRKGWLSD